VSKLVLAEIDLCGILKHKVVHCLVSFLKRCLIVYDD